MRTAVLRRTAAVAVAAATATLTTLALTPGAASAHVTVSSASGVQGGYAKITFRVPNEKDSAGTAKLEVNLPADQPIRSVSTRPLPGWTVATEKAKLATPIRTDTGEVTEAVVKITWTAAPDAVVQPGQFQEFDLSLGPLPKADKMVFKALQTYSDGEVVRWIEEPVDGSAEPENPAPVLKLAAAADGGSGSGATTGAAAGDTAASDDTGRSDGGEGTNRVVAVSALVLGVAGLVLGLLAYRRSGGRPTG